jgi:4-aminobutyrate aminotransferase-like enzyme
MGITHVKGIVPGPKGKALLEQWHKFEADVTGYQAPVVWDSAKGCVVTDVDGNKYIDWTSGVLVTNVGHCHPHLVKATNEAAAKLLNNYECPHPWRVAAAKKLVEALPEHLDKCFFLSTGSEAIEAAIRLVKRRSGKYEMLSFEGGFHGRTIHSASVSECPGRSGITGRLCREQSGHRIRTRTGTRWGCARAGLISRNILITSIIS